MKKTLIYIAILVLFLAPIKANAALPAGCEIGYNFSVLTGQRCVEASEKTDCLEGHKFSIVTGQPCTDVVGELLAKVEKLEKRVQDQESNVVVPLAPLVEAPKEKKAQLDAVISSNSVFQVSLEGFSDETTQMVVTPPNSYEEYHTKKNCFVDANGKKSCTIVKKFTKEPPLMFSDIKSGTYDFRVDTMGQEIEFELVKVKNEAPKSVNIEVY